MNVEELLFHQYKDQIIVTKKFKKEIIKKYNLTDEQARNIHVRINNYQIQTYGERIGRIDLQHYYSKSEWKRINDNAKQRRYSRRKQR